MIIKGLLDRTITQYKKYKIIVSKRKIGKIFLHFYLEIIGKILLPFSLYLSAIRLLLISKTPWEYLTGGRLPETNSPWECWFCE